MARRRERSQRWDEVIIAELQLLIAAWTIAVMITTLLLCFRFLHRGCGSYGLFR
jgi:hypothetical protein